METNGSSTDLQSKILAGRILSLSAGRASAALDQFSIWLLSGFGAAFALLLTNIAPVSEHLAVSSLRCALLLFLIVLVLGMCSRLLAAIVGAGVGAATEAEPIGRDLAEANIEVNFKIVFQEVEKATFWPMQRVIASSFQKVEQGDFAANGRLLSRLTQVQGILVFLQVILVAIAVWKLACGLAV